MQKVEVFVRADGREGYVVGVRNLVGPPIELARYRSDTSTIPPTTNADARASAHAHKQGIIDGMRFAANVLEGVLP